MIASSVEKNQWQEIRNIYIEAFPQKERKPFWVLQHSVKCGKVQIFVETVNNAVQGFSGSICKNQESGDGKPDVAGYLPKI